MNAQYDAIAEQLAARDHTDLSAAELARIELQLQRLVAEVWHTEEIRRNRPIQNSSASAISISSCAVR